MSYNHHSHFGNNTPRFYPVILGDNTYYRHPLGNRYYTALGVFFKPPKLLSLANSTAKIDPHARLKLNKKQVDADPFTMTIE
jgi:hypothetical protein